MDYGRRLSLFRELVATGLGAAVIIDALVSKPTIGQWVAGLVLLGIIPIDAVLARLRACDDKTGGAA